MRALVDRLGRWWIERQHGLGEPQQSQFYRCRLCTRLVSHRRIATGGCRCGGTRISPAMLTWGEKARILALPWTV